MTPYLVYCLKIWENASDINLQPLITTHKQFLKLLLFRHTALIHTFYLIISMSFPSKKLLFLRIGLKCKYEYGQLPYAINMFFVKNRYVHNYNTRNKDKLRPAIAKHAYRDTDFRLVGVHVWNYIYIYIYKLPHHSLHLKGY